MSMLKQTAFLSAFLVKRKTNYLIRLVFWFEYPYLNYFFATEITSRFTKLVYYAHNDFLIYAKRIYFFNFGIF